MTHSSARIPLSWPGWLREENTTFLLVLSTHAATIAAYSTYAGWYRASEGRPELIAAAGLLGYALLCRFLVRARWFIGLPVAVPLGVLFVVLVLVAGSFAKYSESEQGTGH